MLLRRSLSRQSINDRARLRFVECRPSDSDNGFSIARNISFKSKVIQVRCDLTIKMKIHCKIVNDTFELKKF